VDRRADRITDVTGPITTAGTRYSAWFGRMRSPSEILQVDRPTLVRTRFGSWLLRGVEQATFVDQGHGTRLTREFWTNGIISAVMARIFAFGSYKGSFRGELKSFARLAEREAGTPKEGPQRQTAGRSAGPWADCGGDRGSLRGVSEDVRFSSSEPDYLVEPQSRFARRSRGEVERPQAALPGHRCHGLEELPRNASATHRLVYNDIFNVTSQSSWEGKAHERRHPNYLAANSCDEQLSGLVGDDRVEATTVEGGGRRELAKQPSKRRRIVRRDRTERFHGD
jgi:hypothetical protein